MLSHHQKTEALNERRPPLAPAPKPAPAATPAGSFYERVQAGPLLTPATFRPPAAATRESQAMQRRQALKTRERMLLRELKPIENELAAVRQQLATLN